MAESLRHDAIELKGFLDAVFVSPPDRVQGTAVFPSARPASRPTR